MPQARPLRVLLDLNIWIANLIATDKGHRETASQRLVAMVSRGEWGSDRRRVQLVASFEMLDTLEVVLERQGARLPKAKAFTDAILNTMRYGPDELDPYLLLGGREQFAMTDREDAGVLATAFGSRTDLLVTHNLKDFATNDALSVDTQLLATSVKSKKLQALRHRRGDVDVVVAHPFDVMSWLSRGYDFDPDRLWESIGNSGRAGEHTK